MKENVVQVRSSIISLMTLVKLCKGVGPLRVAFLKFHVTGKKRWLKAEEYE